MLRVIERPGEWKPSGAIVRAEEYEALLDAEGMIADAKAEAERIRTEAAAEFERQRVQGREEGLRIAKEESSERAIVAVAETIRGFKSAEAKLVAVVDKAIRKIVGELPIKDRIAGMVRQALAELAAEGKAKVRVSAEDLEAARSAIAAGGSEFVEIAPDPRLLAGSCMIETDAGVIDAALDTQLKAIDRAIKGAVFGDPEAKEPDA